MKELGPLGGGARRVRPPKSATELFLFSMFETHLFGEGKTILDASPDRFDWLTRIMEFGALITQQTLHFYFWTI